MRAIDADRFECVMLQDCTDEFAEGAEYILEKIDESPTLDVEPIIHAHWIKMKDDDPDDFRCSNCKAIAPIDEEAVLRTGKIHRFCSPRCMWCGAIMKGKEFEL